MRIFFFILMTGIFPVFVSAQVSINNDGSSPSSSAMPEVKSTNKGFLPPRLNRQNLDALVDPENGLMVFCTDCNPDSTSIIFHLPRTSVGS